MERPRKWYRHWITYVALGGVAVAVIGVAATIVGLRLQTAGWIRDLASSDVALRRKAVEQVGIRRVQSATDALIAMLQREQDRDVMSAAAYALLRLRCSEAVDPIRRRADESPDDQVRAELIMTAARLSQRDPKLQEWLDTGLAAGEPWRAMGCAVGLVELGRPEGGLKTIEQARHAPAAVKTWGLQAFARTAKAVAQAIGQPMSWLESSPAAANETQLASLESFWRDRVDARTLCDVLQRLNAFDRDWAELQRLIHARDRAARFLQ